MIISLPTFHFAEGYFTIDVVYRLLSATLLDPVLTFLLPFYQLQRLTSLFTQTTAAHALQWAIRFVKWREVFRDPWMLASLVVWGIGLLVKLNQELTRASRNNFRGNKQGWENWQGRVVLITGGKSTFFRKISFSSVLC